MRLISAIQPAGAILCIKHRESLPDFLHQRLAIELQPCSPDLFVIYTDRKPVMCLTRTYHNLPFIRINNKLKILRGSKQTECCLMYCDSVLLHIQADCRHCLLFLYWHCHHDRLYLLHCLFHPSFLLPNQLLHSH